MMRSKKTEQKQAVSVLLGVIGLLGVVGLSVPAQAMPILLPAGEIAKLDYIGAEFFLENPSTTNFQVDPGESFEGALLFTNITNGSGSKNLSGQLANKELTLHFKFTALRTFSTMDPANDLDHIDFGLVGDDFVRFYVGEGPTKNFDLSLLDPISLSSGFPPPLPLPARAEIPRDDIIAMANDGELWIEILPGDDFFESVNDRVPGTTPPFQTRNLAWQNITVNNTGYSFLPTEFFTSLGLPGISPDHVWDGNLHGDHAVQMAFTNEAFAFSPSFFMPNAANDATVFPNPDGFTFNIRGSFFLRAATPEPLTASMGLMSLAVLSAATRRRRWA